MLRIIKVAQRYKPRYDPGKAAQRTEVDLV